MTRLGVLAAALGAALPISALAEPASDRNMAALDPAEIRFPMPAAKPAEVVLPFMAPTGPVPTPVGSPAHPSSPMDSALSCMAKNLYFEARGQPRKGIEAVAHVVLNRVSHRQFPRSVCGVIKEGGLKGPCQFSWYCDRISNTPGSRKAYARVLRIAYDVMNGETSDPTNGANMFHNTTVRPRWARVAQSRGRIGGHLFYYLRKR